MKDYSILVEYKLLKEDAPKGVYLMPAIDDLRLFYGVIFVELGMYRNGVFKFRLELPAAYPADGALPKVTFVSRVFHPYVHPSSLQVNLKAKFPVWRAGAHQLSAVLKFLKQMFYLNDYAVPNPSNVQASQLYQRSRNSFLSRVEASVNASLERRFVNEAESTVKFTEPSAQHRIIRKRILRRAQLNQDDHDDELDDDELDDDEVGGDEDIEADFDDVQQQQQQQQQQGHVEEQEDQDKEPEDERDEGSA